MINSVLNKLLPSIIKFYLLRKYHILKNKHVKIEKHSQINFNTIFEGWNYIYSNTKISDSFIGRGTYISSNSRIRNTKIGRFCAIGQNVQTLHGTHPTSKFVSIHPAFFSTGKQAGFTFVDHNKFQEHNYIKDSDYVVHIGNDVWIANDVRILDGVTIGDGAIIGMGSIVTKNIEPYSINVGIPTKKIKYRFDEKNVNKLLSLQWWNYNFDWLQENSNKFINVANF